MFTAEQTGCLVVDSCWCELCFVREIDAVCRGFDRTGVESNLDPVLASFFNRCGQNVDGKHFAACLIDA